MTDAPIPGKFAAFTPALRLAHIIDKEAYEDHPIEARRHAAALQWGARRKMAYDAAVKVLAAGYVPADRAGREGAADEAELARTLTSALKGRKWAEMTPLLFAQAAIAAGWRK